MLLRHEVLPGLPPYGPTATPFGCDDGFLGGWSGHCEGFVVRFYPQAGEPWVGNFQPGTAGLDGALHHPDGQHLIIFARGQGYVLDPETRHLALTFAGSIQHAIELRDPKAIVFCDGLRFEAINRDGVWWTSPRISWDEIRNIRVEGMVLRGEASEPGCELWHPFTVDLMTGRCEDGIYEEQMRRARPLKSAR
jgi:hypothetical protein